MTNSGALMENGKKILEFVAIQRKDNQEWAIPGVSVVLISDEYDQTNPVIDFPLMSSKIE
jgi:hypothetical protein